MNQVVLESGEVMHMDNGILQSVEPATAFFGFTYFSHLVPPSKPDWCLILGYGKGTVDQLIQTVWGKTDTIGVDIANDLTPALWSNDAREYIKKCARNERQHDYIVIDLWNGNKVCDFVFEPEFVENLAKVSSLRVGMNIDATDVPRLEEYQKYFKLELVRKIQNDKPTGNVVVFWKKKS